MLEIKKAEPIEKKIVFFTQMLIDEQQYAKFLTKVS